jgi:hypothetical protein
MIDIDNHVDNLFKALIVWLSTHIGNNSFALSDGNVLQNLCDINRIDVL